MIDTTALDPFGFPFGGWGVLIEQREDAMKDFAQRQHVIPVLDIAHHVLRCSCPCRPALEGEIWVHNAYDRREMWENLRVQ